MANIRFSYTNYYSAVAAALVASSSVTAMPVDATKNTDRNYTWRSSTSTGAPTIDIDLGAVLELTCAMLANVTVLGAGVVELYQRGDGGSAGAATLVATFPAQDTLRRTTFVYFAAQSHRHWQLTFTNPSVVNSYAELGYGFLGTYIEPAVNVRVPIGIGRQDPTVVSQSVDGQKGFALRTKFQTGTWTFDAVLEAQRAQLEALFDAIGIAEPMFVTLDTTLAWTCWMARVSGAGVPVEIEPGLAIGRYGLQIPWEEVR